MPGRPLMVEAVSVEAVGAGDAPDEPRRRRAAPQRDVPPAADTVRMYHRRHMASHAALFERERPRAGRRASRARRSSPRRTRPPWSSPAGRRDVTRARPPGARRASQRDRARTAIGTTVDPVMLEVFNNLFMSIAEQMGLRLQNTAYSVNIKERLDFSCALFDAEGNLIANAPHMPVHLGSMGESIKTVIRENAGRMQAGRRLRAERPVQRRHAPARRHRDHAGVRRRRRNKSCSTSARAATTPTSAASRRARCRRSRRRSRRRAC